jgi:hypothetical protein
VLRALPDDASPFTEPRYLQTLCALLAAQDLSLCERVLQFLLFHVVQIRESRTQNVNAFQQLFSLQSFQAHIGNQCVLLEL